MKNKIENNNYQPREVPIRIDPSKHSPIKDSDLSPNNDNPVNPNTDESDSPKQPR